ncbi:transcription-repair coupling factor [Coprobacter tertius]|uniref:Transcription-repair-coupling factor n=1 Tax=Coprobacter tertius TaxID=2944915 RepID=A0ABT1MF16_9BACT|nr:transcription-repair coupling factor [Coprobacter tertius]MCP9611212.1 transcription-repair coupling factor [Coprobacter tertius]
MDTNPLYPIFNTPARKEALAHFIKDKKSNTLQIDGLQGSAAALLFSSLTETGKTFILVANDLEEAGYLYHDLVQIKGEEYVLFFPSGYKRDIKYGQQDPANAILRTETLNRLQDNGPLLVVTYPDALAEKVVKAKMLNENTLKLKRGSKADSIAIADTLHNQGFEQVDYVYEPGQYAIRGSILDVYSFSHEQPYRIDFFGDEIESIRCFDIESQLSNEQLDSISIVPDMASGGVYGVSLPEFVNSDTIWCFKDVEWCLTRINSIATESISEQLLITEEGDLEIHKKIVDPETFKKNIFTFKQIGYGTRNRERVKNHLSFNCVPQPVFHKNFDLVGETLTGFLKEGYTLYILSDNEKQIQRLQSIFEDRGDQITFTPILRTIHEGFSDKDLKICFFTDHQIFDRFHKYNLRSDKARSGKLALTLKELNQFEPGDYIVHIDHGVGKFGGLIRTEINGRMQEVIKLIYQNDDIIFVSIHALHKLAKYRGKEGEPPRINKLGTGAWERMKEKTKSKMKDIARDLIKLYAKRREEKGHAYPKDSFLQQELEASFIYEDTPDQLKSTAEVKQDMESEQPMDRLICGDVGFGKTEIAIRAAFKAVCDNKQVAVLVPTTVLAFQHYKTFTDRLKEFPIKIDYLSRARKSSDIRQLLNGLPEGKTDILIGTHRIIGKDVKFKDLGLLIIDEEQKFGVAVKEKLKQMKVNVDTLTMSATPIPRTLQFSLMGARDLSVITTPPPNRYPIQTEVHGFNEEIIREAINFEMSRNGQVFIVNNRIQQLDELANIVRRLVPDARVGIGHGQMEPEKLEQTIIDFANYDYDVLVATTIIESGIDIPNTNTIIINNAHNFGLSELHQLRGRVGRSNKKAFCYLLTPPLHTLSTDARRRLQAIENFSELGSGIHIAMQDLDIRGAGNLLGAEQSGFIADLGYETYQKVLKEAVEELKNDEFKELYNQESRHDSEGNETFVTDCVIESDLELLFPNDYIPNVSERISLYQELDNMERETDIANFSSRLEDRFGRIPEEGKELIRIVRLRQLAKQLGMEKVVLKQGRMILFFVSDNHTRYFQSPAFGKVLNYLQTNPKRCQLRELKGKRSLAIAHIGTVETAVAILQEILNQNVS